jgi:hypothetical protein
MGRRGGAKAYLRNQTFIINWAKTAIPQCHTHTSLRSEAFMDEGGDYVRAVGVVGG